MKTFPENNTALLDPPLNAGKPANMKTPQMRDSAHEDWGDDEEKPAGFRKWLTPLIVVTLSGFAIWQVGKKLAKADGSGVKKEQVAVVEIALPPPPVMPTPPPQQEQPKEDDKVDEKEEQEAEPEPEPQVTTASVSKGASSIQIAAGRGNYFIRKPVDTAAQTKWKGFAGQVARSIEDALRRNPKTKTASGSGTIRVWLDSGGRITRIVLDQPTGNAALDAALREDALLNLQTSGVTPGDMPQPVRLRIGLRRP